MGSHAWADAHIFCSDGAWASRQSAAASLNLCARRAAAQQRRTRPPEMSGGRGLLQFTRELQQQARRRAGPAAASAQRSAQQLLLLTFLRCRCDSCARRSQSRQRLAQARPVWCACAGSKLRDACAACGGAGWLAGRAGRALLLLSLCCFRCCRRAGKQQPYCQIELGTYRVRSKTCKGAAAVAASNTRWGMRHSAHRVVHCARCACSALPALPAATAVTSTNRWRHQPGME